MGEAIRVGFDCLPSKVQHVIPFLGDLFYTYVSIVACDRRLGEEYTYVAKYKVSCLLLHRKSTMRRKGCYSTPSSGCSWW